MSALLDAITAPLAKVVRTKQFHQVALLIYLAITANLAISPTLRESVLLVLAISIETAMSTHVDGWAIEDKEDR